MKGTRQTLLDAAASELALHGPKGTRRPSALPSLVGGGRSGHP
jgi:hypothetical protein